jgi:hypothetical protein
LPRKGYKSISITQDVYDYFRQEYDKVKKEYAVKGVRSFSGFISKRLAELMEEEKKHTS